MGITSYKKHVADVTSDHALFTNLRLRDLFSEVRRDRTEEFMAQLVDTLS